MRAISPPLFLLKLWTAFSLVGGLLPGASFATADSPPNFVFVIADDCTFRDIGCYGGQARTPNIDRLAEQGMKMTHCFQCAPMCSPTRHNIYTGQYPVKTGAYPNHTVTYDHVKSVVQHLRPLGYRVALSGKTHIGPKSVFDFEYSGAKNPDMDAIDQLVGQCVAEKTPFCVFACSNEPHSPWNKGDASVYPPAKITLPPYVPDTPVVRDSFSRYLAEISFFDSQIGEIMELLDKHDATNDTVLMVVSEQGNSFPFAKWTCYDNGLQSAMLVRWPGKIEPGSVTDAMLEYVDITPTFVDLAGGRPYEQFDGRSFADVLMGKTDQHKDRVYGLMTTRGIINGNECFPIRSIRTRTHKLIWNLKADQKFTNACTSSKEFRSMVAAAEAGDKAAQKAVNRYHYRPKFEFYDVVNDPMEMNNLAAAPEHKALIAEMKEELRSWMKSQGDEGVDTELVANHHKQKSNKKKKKR